MRAKKAGTGPGRGGGSGERAAAPACAARARGADPRAAAPGGCGAACTSHQGAEIRGSAAAAATATAGVCWRLAPGAPFPQPRSRRLTRTRHDCLTCCCARPAVPARRATSSPPRTLSRAQPMPGSLQAAPPPVSLLQGVGGLLMLLVLVPCGAAGDGDHTGRVLAAVCAPPVHGHLLCCHRLSLHTHVAAGGSICAGPAGIG